MQLPVGVGPARCALVADASYPSTLVSLVAAANRRCWASVFIVDTSSATRWFAPLFAELEGAVWRGVDVRMVLGGSRTAFAIAERVAGARSALHARGIPCRWLTAVPGRGSHAKVVVSDDHVLVGSHNWSPGAFEGQRQDSLLVRSPDLAAAMAGYVGAQWARAGDQA